MASLLTEYIASGLSSPGLKRAGATAGAVGQGTEVARRRRRRLLENAVKEGKLSPQKLGASDAALLGSRDPKIANKKGDGFQLTDLVTGPAGFLGNLGEGIARAGAGLIPGIVQTAGAVGSDLYSQLPGGPESRLLGEKGSATRTKVIEPTIQSYKERYGQGDFWRKLYEDPFPYLLDIGTVATGGATGAARAGRAAAPKLTPGTTPHALATGAANWVSRGGRAPLQAPGGNQIEREYTPRILSRLGQKGIDRVAGLRGGDNPVSRFQYRMEMRRQKRVQKSMEEALTQRAQQRVVEQLPTWAEFDSPAEGQAAILTMLGLNRPALVEEFERMVNENTLSDQEKMKALQNRGIDPAYVSMMANIPEETKQFINAPSEKILRAQNEWENYLTRMRPELGIDEVTHERHKIAAQDLVIDRILPSLREYWHGTDSETAEDFFNKDIVRLSEGRVVSGNQISPTLHAGTKRSAQERLQGKGAATNIPTEWDPDTGLPTNYEMDPDYPTKHKIELDSDSVLMRLVRRDLQNPPENRPGLREDPNRISPEGIPQWRDAQGEMIPGANPLEEALHFARGLDTQQAANFERNKDRLEVALVRTVQEIDDADNILADPSISGDMRSYQIRVKDQLHNRLAEYQDRLEQMDALVARAEEEFSKGVLPYENETEHPGSESIVALREGWAAVGHPSIRTPSDDYGAKLSYVPIREATNFSPFRPGLLSKLVPSRFRPGEGEFSRGPRDVSNRDVTQDNLYVDPLARYTKESSLETFQQGTFRTDPRLIIEEATRMERDLIEKHFKDENLQKWGAKDEEGELLRFATKTEMLERLGPGFELVPDKFPIQWFAANIDHLKQVGKTYQKLQEEGGNLPTNLNIDEFLEEITDADARAFVSTHWGAIKRKGVAMPKEVFDYDKAFAELQLPYSRPEARFVARQLHRWRTLTLSYMPRWALNTAVGSFVMNSIRGVTPLDYLEANRLNRTFVDPDTGETVTQPGMMSQFLKRGENVDTTGMEPVLPAGVSLGQQSYHEVMDLAGPAYGKPNEGLSAEASLYARKLGIGFPTRKILMAVQGIEDFFRRAAFVRNLRREQGLAEYSRGGPELELLNPDGTPADGDVEPTVREEDQVEDERPIKVNNPDGTLVQDFTLEEAADIIQSPEEYDLSYGELSQIFDQMQGDKPEELAAVGEVLSEHMDLVLKGYRGDIDQALQDPQVVARALQETNKMAYNYGILGPFERRVVRQFIPFWGWYKFISMAAARLPIEYPGRTNIINTLSTIAQDQQEEYGMMPPWLKGVIPLTGPEDRSNFGYLSTMGLNPFSSFINPLSPKGLFAGLGTLGQGNPGIQALLSAAGYDTLTGDTVRISPEEGVGRDYLGRLRDENTGQDVSPMEVAPGRRFLMGLLRSFPQYRIGEQAVLNQGASVYPEHVPFVAPRFMSPAQEDSRTGMSSVLTQVLGVNPKQYDLQKYQNQAKKSAEYIKTRNRNDLLRKRAKFRGGG